MFENKNKTNKLEPISDNLVIKKMRLIRGMTRNEAALIFSYSRSSIERIENGRSQLTKDKIQKFVEGYGFKMQEFINLKLGKSSDTIVPENPVKRIKIIEHNELRRSYKKIITNEVIALKRLRKRQNLSQYEASSKCGWWRGAIGHIEHGRIELYESKIKHIVQSYGCAMKDFYSLLSNGIEQEKLECSCINLIKKFDPNQLKAAQAFLKTLSK